MHTFPPSVEIRRARQTCRAWIERIAARHVTPPVARRSRFDPGSGAATRAPAVETVKICPGRIDRGRVHPSLD